MVVKFLNVNSNTSNTDIMSLQNDISCVDNPSSDLPVDSCDLSHDFQLDLINNKTIKPQEKQEMRQRCSSFIIMLILLRI